MSECILWKDHGTARGYGTMIVNGKRVRAQVVGQFDFPLE